MILTIDNFDGAGARDYTSALDAERPMRIIRKLNRPARAEFSLLSGGPQFVVPSMGARIKVARGDGYYYFTGYLVSAPEFDYLGWAQAGPAYRYGIVAISDEWILDRKSLAQRPRFTSRAAGSVLKQITEDLAPDAFDTSQVQELETLPSFAISLLKKWSDHAAEIALRTRAVYRAHDGKVRLGPLGASAYTFNEADESASPAALKLRAPDDLANDVIVSGQMEPRAYVKDYFLGDGLTSGFSLSHTPFTKTVSTIFEEEFKGGGVDPLLWNLQDPAGAISVSAGKLKLQGGTGSDGETVLQFVEQVQLGGALRLQHGELEFSAPTNAIVGGLYSGAVLQANCLAGFRISPSGTVSAIQAIVKGSLSGPGLSTVAGHRYALTTRLYCAEPYRTQQLFHSSAHAAGSARGGATVAAQLRIVLEAHDIDPANPGSFAAVSTLLYDGVISNAPAYCTYALVNALSAHCTISFAQMSRGVDAEVRSTLPNSSAKTRLIGNVAEGAECGISQHGHLQFFSPYVPAPNEAIEVRYRNSGRALARVLNASSITAHARSGDNGTRSVMYRILQPAARTSVDCENAALAILDDRVQQAWSGEYECWGDFLPGGENVDPLPGDALNIVAPNRNANFSAIIRDVELEIGDPGEDRTHYKIAFSNDAATTNAFQFEQGALHEQLDPVTPGTTYTANVPDAEITSITSTTVDINAGLAPTPGGGIEVRRSDSGWNPDSDHNLIGRFTAQSFTVPRLARVQTYYLRQFDGSSPRKYSRYSTVLYVDYPF